MYFYFRKDIFNHKNIYCFSLFNNGNTFFMINIYSDDYQSDLKYLKDTEVNIWNMLIMAEDFNIKDSDWDLSYSFHSFHSDTLLEIVESFNFKLSCPNQQISTCYFNNGSDSNSVIDLFFLWSNLTKINNYSVLPELWYPSDHASLIVDIYIAEEFIQDKRCIITNNSEEEEKFTFNLIKQFRSIDTLSILNKDSFELVI